MPKIRYIKNEFRFGITEYKTPCPFGMRDRYALQVYEVASRMCKDFPHFVKDDQFNSVLTCNYQEKQEHQEKEHQEKNVFDAADLRKSVKELQEYGVKEPNPSLRNRHDQPPARKKKAAKPGGRKKKGGAG